MACVMSSQEMKGCSGWGIRSVTRVRPGLSVELNFEGFGGQVFCGRLGKIRPRSEIRDDDNVFVAEVLMDNSDHRLRPGMKGHARIIGDRRSVGWIVFHRAWEKVRTRFPW